MLSGSKLRSEFIFIACFAHGAQVIYQIILCVIFEMPEFSPDVFPSFVAPFSKGVNPIADKTDPSP